MDELHSRSNKKDFPIRLLLSLLEIRTALRLASGHAVKSNPAVFGCVPQIRLRNEFARNERHNRRGRGYNHRDHTLRTEKSLGRNELVDLWAQPIIIWME